jgi:transposase-like protein
VVQALGIEHLSKSQVRRMAKEGGVQVAAFLSRPLDGGHYT